MLHLCALAPHAGALNAICGGLCRQASRPANQCESEREKKDLLLFWMGRSSVYPQTYMFA